MEYNTKLNRYYKVKELKEGKNKIKISKKRIKSIDLENIVRRKAEKMDINTKTNKQEEHKIKISIQRTGEQV